MIVAVDADQMGNDCFQPGSHACAPEQRKRTSFMTAPSNSYLENASAPDVSPVMVLAPSEPN
jgi:hypothetical protein